MFTVNGVEIKIKILPPVYASQWNVIQLCSYYYFIWSNSMCLVEVDPWRQPNEQNSNYTFSRLWEVGMNLRRLS